MLFYKVATLGFRCFFWLHQGMNTTSYVGILLLLAGAPKDRDGGICESPLPYPLDSNSSTRGFRCGGILLLPRVYRDIGFRCPVQVDYRHFDVKIGCFVFGFVSFAFQMVLLGLYRLFFIIGLKKDAVCVAFLLVFLITADRDYCSNFARCKSISPNRLGRTILEKAFVRFRLLMIWYSIMLSAKEAIQPRVSLRNVLRANPTKDYGKNLK